MNIKKIFVILISVFLMFLFIFFSEEGVKGAVKGLVMCSDVVIPSLFPFGVFALFLYNSNVFIALEKKLTPFSKFLFGINGRYLTIFIMSFLGGYPIGAILLENLYSKGEISKKTAEKMLIYSVNSGPAFIILGVGQGVFSNIKIGILLFASNFLAALLLSVLLRKKSSYENKAKTDYEQKRLTDTFVESTAQASNSILSVCSFVILFSGIIGIISALPINTAVLNFLSGFLEITNSCFNVGKNVYLLSFLLGFGGFCIHFQILSVLKTLKPSYILLFFSRIAHGFLSLLFSMMLFKLFPVSIETLAQNAVGGKISSISLPFSAFLIFMCATFLFSIKDRGRNI